MLETLENNYINVLSQHRDTYTCDLVITVKNTDKKVFFENTKMYLVDDNKMLDHRIVESIDMSEQELKKLPLLETTVDTNSYKFKEKEVHKEFFGKTEDFMEATLTIHLRNSDIDIPMADFVAYISHLIKRSLA